MIFSCFVQAVAGFGLPMIAMPVLIGLLGIKTAVPLVAIVILQLQILMIVRYRLALNLQTVWRISGAAILGIPVGVLFLSRVPEQITITLLGLVLIFYALYSLLKLPLPGLENEKWSYLFGFIGGIGGGAYNMAAPPIIIYADTQHWEPKLFKGNLQGYFLIIGLVVILTHGLSGNINAPVLQYSLIAIPFVLIGAFSGFYLDRFLNGPIFRKIVLALMVLLGLTLILS